MPGLLLAQWPVDPAVNFLLSGASGEETISKVVPTSDDGCYSSWWNNTSGHYCMYLQRLNGEGTAQWAEDGLLISDHPQESWLTDYDLAVDSADHAIIALNDIRAGGDWDIYAYRISPSGEFIWGANGVTISDNAGFEPDPRVVVTPAGNVVIGWQEENMVHLRKLTPEGADFWNPATKTLTSMYGLSIPRLAIAGNDDVILQLLVSQGPNYYDPKHLYAHKFDAVGNPLWGSGGVRVQNAGGFGPQMRPAIVTDGAGGAFSYWYDDRTVLHAYAQHINSDGTMAWTVNGVVVSTTSDLQMNPSLVHIPATGDVMLFYENTNSLQTIGGVYGQKINSMGVRQWGNGGIAFVPMSAEARMLIRVNLVENDAVVAYLENPTGDFVNTRLKAMRVDGAGSQVWDPSPVTMASVISQKGYHSSCANYRGQVISVWQDKRYDGDGDIYLQNVNPDGTFGPMLIPELTDFSLISPPDEDTIETCYPFCVWTPSVDTAGGYPVSYQVYISGTPDFDVALVSDTLLDTSWACNSCLPYGATEYWKVIAFNGHAPNRTSDQVFTFTVYNPGGCEYIPGDVNGVAPANGIDVTYGVAYFKGGNPPPVRCDMCPQTPPFYAALDVNGSCSTNGIDITYFVAFLKGGAPLMYCPTCPPIE
jgi:hypothetical protein